VLIWLEVITCTFLLNCFRIIVPSRRTEFCLVDVDIDDRKLVRWPMNHVR
jgi:hypothetical protein